MNKKPKYLKLSRAPEIHNHTVAQVPANNRLRPLRLGRSVRVLLPLSLSIFGLTLSSPASAVISINPAHNIAPVPNFLSSAGHNPCITNNNWPASNESLACDSYVLQAINNARAQLREHALTLPTNFYSDSTPEQLFVILDLERTAASHPAYLGLNASLSAEAAKAAAAKADPAVLPSSRYPIAANSKESLFGGAWSSGFNVLVADYIWMYDDGWGGSAAATSNIDCTQPTSPGCWAHRDELLGSDTEPGYAQGAGLSCTTCEVGTGVSKFSTASSFVDTIEAFSTRTAPAMTFTWAKNVLPYLPSPISAPTALSLTENQLTTLSSTALVSWTPATGGSGRVYYTASFSPAVAGCTSSRLVDPYYGCASLSPATTYTFSVFAEDSEGNTSNSATLRFTTASTSA